MKQPPQKIILLLLVKKNNPIMNFINFLLGLSLDASRENERIEFWNTAESETGLKNTNV